MSDLPEIINLSAPNLPAPKTPKHNAKVLGYVAAIRAALTPELPELAALSDHEIAVTKQLWRCATTERAVQYAREAFIVAKE